MTKDLSVILPCLNEQDNLVELHARISSTIARLGIDAEIIFVDDGSTDDTPRVIKKLADQKAIRVVTSRHDTNRGIFQSWKSGLSVAKGRFALFMDSDLQNPPEVIADLWHQMQRREAHFVQAARVTPSEFDVRRTRSTKALNGILNWLYRDNAHDSKSGFFIAPKTVAADIFNLHGTYRFPHTFVRVSALSRGYVCSEIFAPFVPRNRGSSVFEDGKFLRVYLQVMRDVLRGITEFKTRQHPARLALIEFSKQFSERQPYRGLRKLLLDFYYATMPLHAWLLRPSSKEVFIALRKTQYASADQLNDFRTRQLIRIVWHAYVNVPYYRDAMNKAGVMPEEIETLDDIRKLPLLSKDDLAKNVHFAMFARNSNWKTTHKIVTSGSTGRPSISYGEQSQLEIRAGSTLRAAEWTGWRIGDRQMRLWHQTLGMSWTQSMREKFDAWLLRRRFVPAFEMTEESLTGLIKSIESFKPVLIDGYAESLNLISSFLRAGRSIEHQPKGIISSAQMLTTQTRQEIETALGTRVFDKYGAREFSGIAYECEKGSRHVMDESYVLELLKEGMPASADETGEVVITDLNNFAVPMIRYRIGDLAVQPKRANCPCGRSMSLIGKIEGRTQALVHCANGRWIPGAFFAHFFKDHESQISHFQVVQKVRGAFDLLVVKNNGWDPIAWQRAIEELKGYVGNTDIKVRFVREIPMLKTGKRTPVTSKVRFDFQNQ